MFTSMQMPFPGVAGPVTPSGCIERSSNTTGCDAAYINTANRYPPLIYNGTRYLLCGPPFGPLTTNFTDLVRQRVNMSNISLTLDIPGLGRMNFSRDTGNGIDFTSPDTMSGIMDFAMKSLMTRGMVGVNESEYDGTNASCGSAQGCRAKPNLMLSANLVIYNASGMFGYSTTRKPNVGYGLYNGTNAPTTIIPCNSTKCSGVSFDGENLSFTVASWSTYIIGSTNYTMRFANGTTGTASVRQATLVANTSKGSTANATFFVNITNLGNSTGEFFNLSFTGIPECNRSSAANGWGPVYSTVTAGCLEYNITGANNGSIIYLLANASRLVEVNFTANSTPGTYTFGLKAQLINSSNFTETFWNLNSTGDDISWAVTVVPYLLTISSPVNATNITTLNNLFLTFSGNYSTIRYINWTINDTNGQEGTNTRALANGSSPLAIGAGNFSNSVWQQMQNVTLWFNDTWGNANSTTVSFVVDNTIPVAGNMTYNTSTVKAGLNETNYINFSSTGFIINISAFDAVTGIHSVQLNISNVTNKQVNLTDINMTFINNVSYANFNFSMFFNPNNYPDGYYNLTLIIRDWTNNVNSTLGDGNLTGKIAIDRQPPNVTIQKPSRAGNLILNTTALATFNVTVADTVTQPYMVIFNLTNSSGAFGVNTTVGVRNNFTNGMVANFSMPIDISKLQDGNYTLKIIANDTLGNTNNTENITFTVDNTVPSIVTWNYSLITQQIMIRFGEVVDYATLDMSKINVSYNDGTGLLFTSANYSLNDGTGGATRHTATNATVMVINLTPSQDTQMMVLKDAVQQPQGQMMVTVGAIKDVAGNIIAVKNMTVGSNWTTYGVELSFLTSIWNTFNLPLTVLQNRSSLGTNYSADNVLDSIRDHYAGVYYYSSSSWKSYVPGRTVNTFTTFSDDTASNQYWIYMSASDKLQIT